MVLIQNPTKPSGSFVPWGKVPSIKWSRSFFIIRRPASRMRPIITIRESTVASIKKIQSVKRVWTRKNDCSENRGKEKYRDSEVDYNNVQTAPNKQVRNDIPNDTIKLAEFGPNKFVLPLNAAKVVMSPCVGLSAPLTVTYCEAVDVTTCVCIVFAPVYIWPNVLRPPSASRRSVKSINCWQKINVM